MNKKQKMYLSLLIFSFVLFFLFSPIDVSGKGLVDETVTVPAGFYRAYWFTTTSDDIRIDIEVQVLSGNDINVYVMDEINFNLWSNSLDSQVYYQKILAGSFKAEATLGSEGKYYVVLDNTYSLITSKSVYIKLIHVQDAVNDVADKIPGFTTISAFLGVLIITLISKYHFRKLK